MTDRETGLLEQGRKLAAWRATQKGKGDRKLSQKDAAGRIRASQGAWAAWETGRKAPDSFYAAALEKLTRGKLQVRARDWAFQRQTKAEPADVAKAS